MFDGHARGVSDLSRRSCVVGQRLAENVDTVFGHSIDSQRAWTISQGSATRLCSERGPSAGMLHSTTVLAVRHKGSAVMAGDGQVTFWRHGRQANGSEDPASLQRSYLGWLCRLRRDSFALFSRFESKLEQYRGKLRTFGGRVGQGLAYRPRPPAA